MLIKFPEQIYLLSRSSPALSPPSVLPLIVFGRYIISAGRAVQLGCALNMNVGNSGSVLNVTRVWCSCPSSEFFNLKDKSTQQVRGERPEEGQMMQKAVAPRRLNTVPFRLMVAFISRSHCHAMSVLLQQNGSCPHSPVCSPDAAVTGYMSVFGLLYHVFKEQKEN